MREDYRLLSLSLFGSIDEVYGNDGRSGSPTRHFCFFFVFITVHAIV